MQRERPEPHVVPTEVLGHGRIDLPGPSLDVLERDLGLAPEGVVARLVHPEHRVEDLHGGVRVHRRRDRGEAIEVAVDELAGPGGVLHRAGDGQLSVRKNEGVLRVDHHQADPRVVPGGRFEPVLFGPGPGAGCQVGVRDLPQLPDRSRVVMRRQLQFG